MTSDSRHDAAMQLWQSIPSVGAIGVWLVGIPIEKWAAFVGMLFIIVQMGYLVWKWRRDIRRDRLAQAKGINPPDTDRAGL